MGLTLLVGPANAGKVALLLERYRAAVTEGRDPFLIVPNRPDVDRVERELLAGGGAVVGGEIGTFDDLFGRIAAPAVPQPPITDFHATLLLAGVVASTPLNGLGASARSTGFVDALQDAVRAGSYGSDTVTYARPASASSRPHCAPVRSSKPYAYTGWPCQASRSWARRRAAAVRRRSLSQSPNPSSCAR